MLPRWHRGIETAVRNPVARDAFRFGLYTGMRLTEVISLAWTHVDMTAMTIRIEDTKSGEPLEFPVTRRLAAILERRFAGREQFAGEPRGWVFPSESSASGHLKGMQHLNARIGEDGGGKFWFHALRNCFITVADRELMLPTSLTKRLVNHAPSQDITVNGGGIMLHARRPGGPVAAAQNCATHGPLAVATRGRRCTAWSSMRRFDWRLSTRV